MQYRDFGKTGAKVSALGFGAMRLPADEDYAIEVIRRALSLGVNYVDTAPYYCDGRSEGIVGRALKGWRDRIFLSTKNPIEDDSGDHYRERLENSLQRLDVDYIDFYHFWGINWKLFEEKINVPNGPLEAAYRAREEGLVRHISFSFHDTPENLVRLIDTGHFESMTVQYNLLDRKNEQAIYHAHAKGLGVAIMGPVGGGRLGVPATAIQEMIPGGVKSTPELALRFVLAHPGVSVALSGMGSLEMVEENVATASRTEPLTSAEKDRIEGALSQLGRLADLYCTGCGYCQPCPNGVNIPENFRLMNYHRVYGLTDWAKAKYAIFGKPESFIEGGRADTCIECGTCEELCPQKLPIIEQLKETHAALAG